MDEHFEDVDVKSNIGKKLNLAWIYSKAMWWQKKISSKDKHCLDILSKNYQCNSMFDKKVLMPNYKNIASRSNSF